MAVVLLHFASTLRRHPISSQPNQAGTVLEFWARLQLPVASKTYEVQLYEMPRQTACAFTYSTRPQADSCLFNKSSLCSCNCEQPCP